VGEEGGEIEGGGEGERERDGVSGVESRESEFARWINMPSRRALEGQTETERRRRASGRRRRKEACPAPRLSMH